MKIIKSRIFIFILGLVIAGGISVFAYQMNATQITYEPKDKDWNVNTVKAAIDDIKQNGTVKKICKLKSGDALAIGSKYECDPGDGTKRNFYVLEVRKDGIDLIMDRNVSEGTMTWNDAMKYIDNNNLKSTWKYVANIDLPQAQAIANAVGYSSWKAVDSGATWWCFASHKQDFPSSPYCNTEQARTYNWLYDYTRACNGCTHSLSDTDGQPYGYWTRDALNETSTARAWDVYGVGDIGYYHTSDAPHFGVRPVITILKSNIS